MGVTLMENYEVGGSAALVEKGWIFPAGNTVSFSTQVENSVNRKKMFVGRTLIANEFGAIKIPIPASKAFYFSTRIRWNSPNIPEASQRLYIANNADIQGAFNAVNTFGFVYPFGTGWRFCANTSLTAAVKDFAVQEWICVEVLRKADGTARVWVNDNLLYIPGMTINAPADNYLYIGRAQAGGGTGGSAQYGWEYMDTVVVDPATAGLQNRPGASSRVMSVPLTDDVVAEWTPAAGVVTPHHTLMANYPAVPVTNDLLTGSDVGKREQYQASTIPVVVPNADKVLAVQIEQRAANPGGVQHSFATEVDVGAGVQEIREVALAGASGFVYRPVFLDKKPDGTVWTAADVAAMKAGFSLKS